MARRQGQEKLLTFQVGLHRALNASSDQPWRLIITDTASRLAVCEVRLEDAQVALLLASQEVDGPGQLFDAHERWGRRMEVAQLRIRVPRNLTFGDWDPALAKELAHAQFPEYVEEGWLFEIPQKWNHHRYGDGHFQVTALRWVEVEEDEA